ncbi:MAG TPA: PVC-type heme-binding CxxCH protein [Isosphaeraceae bacterium]|nr:PVC-type heme-binding CxxCH protein [Isosphaeraceae bacterium]
MRSRFAAVVILLLVASPARAQRDARVPDPDPEVERKSFVVADGFEVNLFAADPRIAKPIQMNFDALGRLWIVSSEVYPQIEPGQVADDKVLVLEDRDGDGKADSTTVFADGLLIPTGVEPGDGGAYVANSTELLHLKDNDGDGKADTRRVVLSGFGTEDTHHILHTLRWGPDGRLYFNQSVYIHSHIETPWGVRRLAGGGAWRLKPDSLRLSVFFRGLVNPWGHHFDRFGQSFATDGAGGEGINYIIPGAAYMWAVDAPRITPGLNPGSPKYCGLEVLSGRHLPDDWRGNLITNDFRGHRVCRFVLKEDGSGFAAKELGELVKTAHGAFRPIDVKMGPDGAIYVADWYNPIIQHGEVDFRDPRRDHTHGRIWRIAAKGRPPVERPKLVGASNEQLLEDLKVPEDWTRHFARRVLVERGRVVLPALAAWVKGLDANDPEVEHHELEALWVYQGLDVVEPRLLATLLDAKDGRVRAAAVRVLGDWADEVPDALDRLATRVADEHPRVRLEAVRALARLRDPRAAALALNVLDRPMDRFLADALWWTERELKPYWLPPLRAGKPVLGSDPVRLVVALEAAGTAEVIGPLLESLKSGQVSGEQERPILDLLAAVGGPRELATVFAMALEDPSAARLDALAAASRRKVRPEGDLDRLAPLLDAPNEDVRRAAVRLAGLWKLEGVRAKLIDVARSEHVSESLRMAATSALGDLGGPASTATLAELAGPGHPARGASAIALAGLDLGKGAAAVAALLAEGTGDAQGLTTAILGRRGGGEALAEALSGKKLPADAAKLALRAARGTGRDESALIAALTEAGSLAKAIEPPTGAARQRLVAEVARRGDPSRGEAVFRRKDSNCLNCHAIAGAGGRVGPDLASIGASAPVDYLVDSLYQPNLAVKEGYHSVVVGTEDGRVVTGIQVRQDDKELVLRDADDREVTLPLSSIAERKAGGSLMPAGLLDTMTEAEVIDLIRFLSELGKVGPYAVGKEAVARRWEVLEATPEAAYRLVLNGPSAIATAEPAAFRWRPAYSVVAGALPLADAPTLDSGPKVALVRCRVEVTTAGPVALRLNPSDDVQLWVDGRPVAVREETVLDLPAGVRTLTFAVPRDGKSTAFRLGLHEVAGSPARARMVLGK